uniref:Uncharacterized protein n=1 Tax=Arundo donax TaxID=35708 RepID=A0A0A9FLF7_ARUDO
MAAAIDLSGNRVRGREALEKWKE